MQRVGALANSTETIDGSGQTELSGTETTHKIATTCDTAFFKHFEHAVHSAETANNAFGGNSFASENSVAFEQLQCGGMCRCSGRWAGQQQWCDQL